MNYNAKRSNIISSLKRKNYKLSKELKAYIRETQQLTDIQTEHLTRLDKNLIACAHESLYSQDTGTTKNIYHASHTCDNKNCCICNYYRQKKIRRKYYKWFTDNKELLEIETISQTGNPNFVPKQKVITQSQFNDNKHFLLRKVEYDIMYLTLTLSHDYEHGYNGNRFYFNELINTYKELRRIKIFEDNVFGGEYGVEITKNKNGLHIHLHSLLFVRKFTQNRNKLHKEIMLYWNKNTHNEYHERKEFKPDHIKAIKAGNKLIDNDFIDSLDPQGTTLIGLETIYTETKEGKSRVKEFNSLEMLKAIMEAISYHFKPQSFDNDNNTYDWQTLTEILPVIYGKRLYDKFGCLRGEKSLNIKATNTVEDVLQDYEDSLNVDTETGELIQSREYFVANPANIYHFGDKNDLTISLSKKAKEQMKKLQCHTTTEALNLMVQLAVNQVRGKRNKLID